MFLGLGFGVFRAEDFRLVGLRIQGPTLHRAQVAGGYLCQAGSQETLSKILCPKSPLI